MLVGPGSVTAPTNFVAIPGQSTYASFIPQKLVGRKKKRLCLASLVKVSCDCGS